MPIPANRLNHRLVKEEFDISDNMEAPPLLGGVFLYVFHTSFLSGSEPMNFRNCLGDIPTSFLNARKKAE